MNKKLKVLNAYDIYVGSGLLSRLPQLINLKKFTKIFVITDPTIKKLWIKTVKEAIPYEIEEIVVDEGENSKNIETVESIWEKLLSKGCDRKSLIINFGGGVILDMGGFAASTFMRGVDFLHIPTTLLSMVDASIGGKVGIDFKGVKNLIGSFNQPIGVICDISTLKTLPDREFISGFAEIVKHGLISDKEYFNFVTSKEPKEFIKKELIEIVYISAKIKANIVKEDEKESGKRRLLNFGHTIGHGVESLSWETKRALLHGEAISIGMVVEAKISQLLRMINEDDFDLIRDSLERCGLPISYKVNKNKVMEKIKSDKKNEKGQNKWTLLEGVGQAVYERSVDKRIVMEALESIYESAN